jgi:predicted  nucleic acid-binding Zn-ribbon protein
MSTETDRIKQLEQELDHLMNEVERYRSAAEDALQQLDWCIGYFAGARKGEVAGVLSANRTHIRKQYLRRSNQKQPV